MSDPRFLNDTREWRHGGHIIGNTVRRLAVKYKPEWLAKNCLDSSFEEMVSNMVRRCENPRIKAYGGYTPFIFSMSADEDSLSQWRSYGKRGYCIAFDAEQIRARTGSELIPIEYKNEDEPNTEIESIIENFFTSHQQHIYPSGHIDIEVSKSGADDFEDQLVRNLFYARYKDPSFKFENEWRLVQLIARTEQNPIFLHESNGYPVPRAHVSIADWGTVINSVIKKIVCAPDIDVERVKQAFELLGYEFPVVPSRVPYREI